MGAGDVAARLLAARPPNESAEPDYSVQLALLAAIVASSDDAIVSKTLDGQILTWNAGAARIFGYQPEEVIGKPITIIIPPELQEEERYILSKVRRGERIEHFDTVRVTRDGRRIPISLTISPVRDSRGTIIGASKIARDISDRKRAEQALQQSERLLAAEADALVKLNDWSARLWRSRTLQQGMDEVLAAVVALLGAEKGTVQLFDRESRVLSIAAQRGFDSDFLQLFAAVNGDDECACGRALRSSQRIVIEDIELDGPFEPFRSAARAAGYRSVVSTPVMASSGTALGIVSAHFRLVHKPSDQELRRLDLYLRQVSDFIQRCSMEDALRRSEEALREADHRKDEFLALLAHELRNPLAPIRYALATNRSGSQTAEQRQRAEAIIDRQVAHMSRLLDDLLDVSRITRGMLELKRSPTDLASVVAAAIETARPLLDARRHALSVELPQPPAQIDADTVRLAQVFSNLLINAAKYTDPGGKIQLRATRTDKEIIVSVRDNGIGISSDMMPRLFRIFSQARSALDRAEGGLGIGLSLVRGLTSLHGGSVEAHSDGPGKGSEFVVRLPLGEPAEPLADRGTTADCSKATADALAATRDLSMTTANGSVITADDPAAARLKILVVDDNRDAADSCAAMLEAAGHRVAKTYSGQRALELGETFHPDAFLLDIGLPDLDGYELARKIRSLPWGRSTVLIAVTGWGQDEHRRRALAAGFDRHLTKPIAPEALSCLLQLLAPMR